jgi:glycosyltransferase involved in cell wall biosynthesis
MNLAQSGHDVYYLFSGAWRKKYNWLFRPYLRIHRDDFPFESAELINSPNWTNNLGCPLVDIGHPQTDKLFLKYIKKINPDIMHVHSRFGLPVSIIEIASRRGIKVFNTIHVYGFLCQKRVMIDQEGQPCSGPSDLEKCADCTGRENIGKLKLIARIDNTNKNIIKRLVSLKRTIAKENRQESVLRPRRQSLSNREKAEIKEGLARRLDYMVHLMNHCVAMNIGVSTDVKRTLMRYGVEEKRLLVQHIGSTIAENQKKKAHGLHNPPVIGNIGGVSYYKGTHLLLDAIGKMKLLNFKLKIFGKYEPVYVDKIMKGRESLPVEFLGRYQPEELPQILDQIDIMVLPSICHDTAPQTIFESYSARVPIIASNIGGFPDFIRDGVNGRLFKPGDSRDLAEKLDEILKSPDKIGYFAQNIPPLKTIKENAEELISLYEKSTVGSL